MQPHICHDNLPMMSKSSFHYVPPQVEVFSCHCHMHHWDMSFDHHYREDFQHNEPVKPFVKPSTRIPLLGHWWTFGIIHISSGAIILVRICNTFYPKTFKKIEGIYLSLIYWLTFIFFFLQTRRVLIRLTPQRAYICIYMHVLLIKKN